MLIRNDSDIARTDHFIMAAGARWLGTTEVNFHALGAAPPWDGPVAFKRALFAIGGKKFAQYYVFSLNGRPESSWEVVRARLSLSPWLRHCYFAKIQFASYGEVTDPQRTEREAGEFVKHCLPSVLEMLPTGETVDRLNSVR